MNAYVNHGRWVVDCPTAYCTQAWLATPGPVTCSECGSTFAPVFPIDKHLIDAALDARLVPATRNWTIGETVQDLIWENENHRHEGVVN